MKQAEMRNLPAPPSTATDSFARSARAIRDLATRQRFESELAEVEARCLAYDDLAARGSLASAQSPDFELPILTSAEMVGLYDHQFTRSVRTADIRDLLRNSAANSLCPYCGQGTVFELDHYLPKTSFAGTTVHPNNLVPSCRDCNREKLAYVPGGTAPAVLHPYFDELLETRWLYASVEPGLNNVPTFSFRADLLGSSRLEIARLEAHLEVFGLHRRFGAWAGQAANDFELLIRGDEDRAIGSAAAARAQLLILRDLHSGGRQNSWERATYEALEASTWFVGTRLGLV